MRVTNGASVRLLRRSGMAVVGVWVFELAEAYCDLLRSGGLIASVTEEVRSALPMRPAQPKRRQRRDQCSPSPHTTTMTPTVTHRPPSCAGRLIRVPGFEGQCSRSPHARSPTTRRPPNIHNPPTHRRLVRASCSLRTCRAFSVCRISDRFSAVKRDLSSVMCRCDVSRAPFRVDRSPMVPKFVFLLAKH